MDSDALVPLVAGFRDTLLRTKPDDIQLKDVLRRLIANDEADFLLDTNEEGHGIGYVQQRIGFPCGGWSESNCGRFVCSDKSAAVWCGHCIGAIRDRPGEIQLLSVYKA